MAEEHAGLSAEMHSAISAVIQHHDEGSMLTRYIVLAEIITGDGERALWQVAAEDMMAWDTLGMLDHARMTEYAHGINPDD